MKIIYHDFGPYLDHKKNLHLEDLLNSVAQCNAQPRGTDSKAFVTCSGFFPKKCVI